MDKSTSLSVEFHGGVAICHCANGEGEAPAPGERTGDDWSDMAERAALVLGGSRRIGRAVSLALARDGHAVAVNARTATGEMEETVALIGRAGGEAIAAPGDVTDDAACAAVVERAASAFGRLDVVVNCVSKREHGRLLSLGMDDWHAALAAVLDAAFLATRHATPHLAATGGTIILISGASAFVGSAGPATPTAKSGLGGFVRSAVQELGPMGVTINIVSPGRIDAEGDSAENKARLARARPVEQIPLRRAGTPEDVADVVAAMASGAFRYVTGQTIHVNGGFYMA